MTTASPTMTGARKAAILFVLLGEEAASTLCRHLPPDAVQRVVEEVATLGSIAPDVASQVLEEYYRLVAGHESAALGGADYASRFLARAFGEERARDLLSRVSLADDSAGFEALHRADPQQLARFMEGEHPQTIALILAHLGPKAAAALLLLPEKVRAEAVKRLAGLNEFSPETVRKILVVLDRKVKMLGGQQDRCAYGGAKAVAELLNRLDATSGKAILEMIEQGDPKQAVEIRNLMFTFDDLLTVPESGIREVLSQLDKKTLAMALKGASEDVKNHIFKCMSSRAVEMMKEDMDALGQIRIRDADQARQEAIAVLRKLEQDGKLTLKTEGDEYVV